MARRAPDRQGSEAMREGLPAVVLSHLIPPDTRRSTGLQRAGVLTPYMAEIILEEAVHAGRGSRLRLTVPAGTSAAGLDWLQERFATLGPRGILVTVEREGTRLSRSRAA